MIEAKVYAGEGLISHRLAYPLGRADLLGSAARRVTPDLRGRGPRWKDVHRAGPIPWSSAGTSWRSPAGRGPDQQIAHDFGIAESCLRNLAAVIDVEDGNRPGVIAWSRSSLREARRRIRLLEQENEALHGAAAYLSQGATCREKAPTRSEEPRCQRGARGGDVSGSQVLARQPYYRWLDAPVGARELEQAYLADAQFDAHRDDPEFGLPPLAPTKPPAPVWSPGERTVRRISSSNGWWSVFGKRRP